MNKLWTPVSLKVQMSVRNVVRDREPVEAKKSDFEQ